MPSTPSVPTFSIPPVQGLPSPSSARSSRPRGSLNNSFSFGPHALVDSFTSGHSSLSFALDANRSVLGHSPLGVGGGGGRSPHKHASKHASRLRRAHPVANDTTDIFTDVNETTETSDDNEGAEDGDGDDEDDDEEQEEYEWDTVDRMRLWRHDALMQHLYETAAFWGDKIVSWTNDPNDGFWLAQTYFQMHQYARAERILTRPFRISTVRPRPAPSSGFDDSHERESTAEQRTNGTTSTVGTIFGQPNNANDNGKGKGKEREVGPMAPFPLQNDTMSMPMQAPGPANASEFGRLPVGPAAMFDVHAGTSETGEVSQLVDVSIACRHLCAQALTRQGRWRDALEMLGESNPFKASARSGPGVRNVDGGIKIEASMCHLRGHLMLKTNRTEQAKLCFMEALSLDVKCYESFEQLIGGEMLGPDEEWGFVQGLAYREQAPDDADFVRLMYLSRLRKHAHADEHRVARRRLVDEFGLGDNPDVLWAFADALYTQFRWADCFKITERILGLVSMHTPTMPLHIACMYHLRHLHSRLFVLAHELVEKEPEGAVAWYAVGVWYLAQRRWADARTYFSKASLMDPRFVPSWVAFAHTFSFEKEHDQAIVAYSSSARNYMGSHLPLLFVGMEHIMLSNHAQADEALTAASKLCSDDPLLVNEQGVMRFNHSDFQGAATLFERALSLAKNAQGADTVWATTEMNLGTSYRKLGRYDAAKAVYKRVLAISPAHPTALAFLGLSFHLTGEPDVAILYYHEALSVDPLNHHVLELLNIALDLEADEAFMEQKEARDHPDTAGFGPGRVPVPHANGAVKTMTLGAGGVKRGNGEPAGEVAAYMRGDSSLHARD